MMEKIASCAPADWESLVGARRSSRGGARETASVLHGSQELAGMGKRGFGDAAGQHAGDFSFAGFAGNGGDVGLGSFAMHDVVGVAANSYLRQVRNNDNLMRFGKVGNDIGKRHGRCAAPPDAMRASGRGCMPSAGR